MKGKYWIIVIIIILIIGAGFIIYKNTNNKNDDNNNVNNTSNNYEASKSSTNVNLENNSSNEQNNTSNEDNDNSTHNTTNITQNDTGKEEELASFTTKIVTKDSSRQNNISITCSTLNDTLVENGSTFSFCNTVGQSTTSKGYQKADIFDANGNKKKGLGGGNCQVSTTLYNAILKVPSLVVTERHEHSNYVPYIQDGKDAAVAYGSYDLKFRNDSGNTIKIKAEPTTNDITIRLIKIT